MALYEHIYLARQDVSPQQVEELTTALTEVLITEGGGKVTKNEYWGLKSLSYRIKKNRKAHYTLLNIDAPRPAVAEMERQMRINEDILRFMTVRVDELEEGPSAMMQKRDRDDDVATVRVAAAWRSRRFRPRRSPPRRAGSNPGRIARNGHQRPYHRPGSPSVPAPPQDLPVLGPECAQDRLQGRPPAAALRFRARQDRPLPHHGRVGQEAARTGPGHQARPLHRHHALRRSAKTRHRFR